MIGRSDKPTGTRACSGCHMVLGSAHHRQRNRWVYLCDTCASGLEGRPPKPAEVRYCSKHPTETMFIKWHTINGYPNGGIWEYVCRKCKRSHNIKYLTKRPMYMREYMREYVYGISAEQYRQMFTEQNALCLICGQPETAKNAKGQLKPLCVDHNHITNQIRALLCHNCNSAIGLAAENPTRLRAMAEYLDHWNDVEQSK